MIAPPPSDLTAAEDARLGLFVLPGPDDETNEPVYRFKDTGEFIAVGGEEAARIRAAIPGAQIRLLPEEL